MFPEFKEFYLQLHSSQLRPGKTGTLSNGIRVAFAFGENDKVCVIRIYDERLKFKGDIGVGTAYTEIVAELGDLSPILLPGYGTLFEIAPRVYAVFSKRHLKTGGYEVAGSDSIEWIEVRTKECAL